MTALDNTQEMKEFQQIVELNDSDSIQNPEFDKYQKIKEKYPGCSADIIDFYKSISKKRHNLLQKLADYDKE